MKLRDVLIGVVAVAASVVGTIAVVQNPELIAELKSRVLGPQAASKTEGAPTKEAQPSTQNVSAVAAPATKRVALVIGQSDYRRVALLKNPVRDARLVGDVLRKLGFETTILANATRPEILKALHMLTRAAAASDVALVYFAGHGISIGEDEYIIPIDARAEKAEDLRLEAVDVGEIRSALALAKQTGLLLIDTARMNPFRLTSGTGATRSPGEAVDVQGTREIGTRGLARLVTRSELVTLYATGLGENSADGEGDNGPFALSVARHLASRGDVLRVMGAIADDVRNATKAGQSPELRVEHVRGTPLCLVACDGVAPSMAAAPIDAAAPECDGNWDAVVSKEGHRLAFVVAESAYAGPNLRPLSATAGDARLMSSALSASGFATRVCYNLSGPALRTQLGAYYKAVESAVKQWEAGERTYATQPVAFFYFSGHGASSRAEGANYIIPLGHDVERASDLPTFAVRVRDIADSLKAAGARAIVVADACRAPLKEGEAKDAASKGWVVEPRRDGAIMAFSAEPGELAFDNHTYASALSQGIKKRPGEDVRLVFTDVRDKVIADTKNQQKPYFEDGLTGRFAFQPPG